MLMDLFIGGLSVNKIDLFVNKKRRKPLSIKQISLGLRHANLLETIYEE